MKPLFSIITVTYNAGKTIERTIRSVMEQTALEQIEYIIIDGASTDNTLEVVRHCQLPTANCQLVSEPDTGLYDAMNKGLRMATGRYVWFLNAGDTLHSPSTIEQLLPVIARRPQADEANSSLDILYGETDIVDHDGRFIAHRRLKAPAQLNWKSFRMGMLVSHQAFIVKRELAPPYDLQYRYSADVDWCIRCMKAAKNIHNTHMVLCNYLNEGLTTANRKASLKERFSIMARYYGWLPTVVRHGWFFARYSYNSILHRQL